MLLSSVGFDPNKVFLVLARNHRFGADYSKALLNGLTVDELGVCDLHAIKQETLKVSRCIFLCSMYKRCIMYERCLTFSSRQYGALAQGRAAAITLLAWIV